MTPTPQTAAARAAEQFNDAHPIGTRVIAFPGARVGRALHTRTRTPAWALGTRAVVSVEDYAGGIALTHIDVIPPNTPDENPRRGKAKTGAAVAAPAQARPTDDHEWTDAELDAAYAAFHAHNGPRRGINEYNEVTCIECGYALSWPGAPMDGGKRAKRHAAREALAAARTARQEQNR